MRTRSTTLARRPETAPSSAGKLSVSAAVLCALYGFPFAAKAQQAAPAAQDAAGGTELGEITVTANRREQTLEAVPYSMSVISAEQLAQANVTDLASLSANVPGLSMYDFGARFAGAVAPIIRGINATAEPTRGFRTFEQNPVGTYIGNSPIDGYFQLDDLKQIEVLRGPQGTLYGAGALGGALRLIPNAPDPSAFAGIVRGRRRPARPFERHRLHHEGHGERAARGYDRLPRVGQVRLSARDSSMPSGCSSAPTTG